MILSPLNALLLLALLLSANFALATNMLPRQRWISSLGFVMLIIVVSITARMSGWGEFSPYPIISLVLRCLSCSSLVQNLQMILLPVSTLFLLRLIARLSTRTRFGLSSCSIDKK